MARATRRGTGGIAALSPTRCAAHNATASYILGGLKAFPNHDVASRVLVPGSLVLLVLAVLMFVWGLLTEARSPTNTCGKPADRATLQAPKS